MSLGKVKSISRGLTALLAWALALIAAAAAAAPAVAMETTERATQEVKRWQSPQEYDSPYAMVKVIHDGRRIDGSPISRCKGAYVTDELAVMISTCGQHWRVKARYVSMSGHRERFKIVYEPRNGV